MNRSALRSHYDFVIVGAGSAGCVLANRLSTSGRVLLIEAGGGDRHSMVRIPAGFPRLYRTHHDWNYASGPEPGANGRLLYVPRGKMLGGSSSMNAMIYMRGRPSDYDEWEKAGASGWNWEAVLPHFVDVEDNARGPDTYHGVGGEMRVEDLRSPLPASRMFIEAAMQLGVPPNRDFNGARQEGVGFFQVTQKRGRRWSASDAFLRPALGRPTLDVATDALVTQVVIRSGVARGVSFVHSGRLRTVGADEVILAAGSIGSPCLLQRSGVGHPDQLRAGGVTPRIRLPAVGANLQDHPVAMVMYRAKAGITLDDAESAANLARWALGRRGPLTSNVAEAGAFVRSPGSSGEPDLQFHFGPVDFSEHGLGDNSAPALTTGPLLLHPSSRGRVTIRSRDPRVPPEIVGNHLTEPEDLPPLLEGIELSREILRASPLDGVRLEEIHPGREVRTREALVGYLRAKMELLYHPVGTCRIGGPEDGVVDPELRVHGVEGLRVADASVMPRIVAGNTHAPTVMIGTRAASLLTGTSTA